jgi:ribose/xylose/arabinose/galactoside ABC-type transport system permease subunit
VRLNLPPFITTLAMMLMARGLAFKLAHGSRCRCNSTRSMRSDRVRSWARHGRFAGDSVGARGWRLVAIVSRSSSTRTRFGRYVFAIGGNEEAARLAGIDVRAVKTLVYVISGGCAALAGLLLMARFASGSPQTGTGTSCSRSRPSSSAARALMGGRGSVVGRSSARC